MFKTTSVSGAPPQTLLEELTTLPKPPSREGLLAFGNSSFAPSALNPPLAPPKQKFPPCYPSKHKIIETPLSWPTDPLNLAVHGSNEIVCVSYWGVYPKTSL